ncbi:MAG TPA: CTP synthase [Bacillota bacterium]|nr:CTP synthase [Clostridiales bacterium]HPT85063.1 CTP synthase [Bacillota bacterium]
MKRTKYVFVTGGVVSGLGKGITAASLGRLLKQRGLKVAAQKLDPYMNVDPGTMSPYQHGEVFVTDDGAETDLDLGHYERFINENLNKYSNLTSGRVYWNVLQREREGGYLGQTVQIIPHITNEIKDFIRAGAKATCADVLITEIGGTIGDIESQAFLEAIRQISIEEGRENCLFIHVTLVPYLRATQEHKSKPTQHSVKELQASGITPNIIITRSDEHLDDEIKEKIALFCNVRRDCVIENVTLPCLYEAPLMLHENGLDRVVCRELGLDCPEPDLTSWRAMVEKIKNLDKTVKIAICGKYTKLHDAYLSINEALRHAGYVYGADVDIMWVDSENVTDENAARIFKEAKGILIPGGFGDRGIEGMISAAKYARENNVPLFGICLGMQIMTIEFARNVCGMKDANSTEFNPATPYPVIALMEGQQNITRKGGTMRLGSYPCVIKSGTLMASAYGTSLVHERHRHRYEFNNDFRRVFMDHGITLCGTSPDGSLIEAIELDANRFYIGVQFHPEFLSRPDKAHPLFREFVGAALGVAGNGCKK